MDMKRYEIWQANLLSARGSCVCMRKCPVVIFSADTFNAISSALTVIPLSTSFSCAKRSRGVALLSGLRSESFALTDQLVSVRKASLSHYIGYVADPDDRNRLNRAVAEQLGLTA